MKVEVVFIRGTHSYSFRCGEWARIVGVEWVTPEKLSPARLCYRILYDDGLFDFVGMGDALNYEIKPATP
jgi:hypothetical protein